ncbi:MAG: diacylglycerol kinase family lipid kinase [Candidatus Cloacimonetes bacterium]|nr:diacylglycerol kinase family lipid kinase [Candidatus Cloacimonadota bacterium]
MRDKKWFFIVNPTAGRGRTGKKINELVTSLNQHKFDFEIELTKSPGHGTKLTKDAILNGSHNIIAVGGDGTLNEIVNGVMLSGKADEVCIGCVPEGGGNDFSTNFHLSSNINKAVNTLQKYKKQKVDIGKIEDKYFINSLGIGFDARVAIISNRIKHLNGLPRYLAAVLKALISLKMFKAEIKIDTGIINEPFLLLSVGNGQSAGGGFLLTPEARVDDGLLDICFISTVNRRRVLKLLPSAIKGKHLKEPEVVIHQTRKIEISSDKALPLYFDGELPTLKDQFNFTIEILPNRIDFIVN